ncbi:MAG: hypothetical protein ABIW76_13195 [Fibrobacteria bacterium]
MNKETETEYGPKVISLRDRLGVRREEIPSILPISMREVEDLISADATFPAGFAVRPNGRKKYDLAELKAWWAAKKEAWRANHPEDRAMA